jgi:hypothetical protein
VTNDHLTVQSNDDFKLSGCSLPSVYFEARDAHPRHPAAPLTRRDLALIVSLMKLDLFSDNDGIATVLDAKFYGKRL